jgi:hypothetical protein
MGPLSSPLNVHERKNLAAGFMLPSVIGTGAVTLCYKREPASLSRVRVVVEVTLLPDLRLHRFHRPGNGTSWQRELYVPCCDFVLLRLVLLCLAYLLDHAAIAG